MGVSGEFIASLVFDIKLEESGHKGSDGRFRSGPHKGKSVNVKWYIEWGKKLDINADNLPDFYLVLTGSKDEAASKIITENVFLFEAVSFVLKLRERGTTIGRGDPTSTRNEDWRAARLRLTEEQKASLQLFNH